MASARSVTVCQRRGCAEPAIRGEHSALHLCGVHLAEQQHLRARIDASAPTSRPGPSQVPLPPEVAGRLWVCGKDTICPDPDRLLKDLEVSAVVCLVEVSELVDYPDYLRRITQGEGDQLTWCPIPDTGVPKYRAALELVDSVVERLRSGRSVIIHCSAGISRSGMIAASVLARLGTPVPEALEGVRRCHGAGPEPGPQLELVERIAAEQPPSARP